MNGRSIKTVVTSPTFKRIVNIICITILAFALEKWIVYDVSSLSFFSNQKSADFELSDFYDQAAYNSGELYIDPDIVIVGIDGCDREGIAQILNAVNSCEPNAIGLDVVFGQLSQEDSLLCHALYDASSRLVYAVLSDDVETGERTPLPSESFINPEVLEGSSPGDVALTSSSGRDVVRTFYSNVPGCATFAVALADKMDPDAVALLRSRGNHKESISFSKKDFYTITSDEILKGDYSPEKIKGKIALLGATDDVMDTHVTPIDETMSGVTLHAYILNTILRQEYRHTVPTWIVNLLSLILSIMIINLCYVVSAKTYSNLVSRIVPIVLILLSLYVGYGYYVRYHWYLNITQILLSVASAMLAFDIWTGVPSLFRLFKHRLYKCLVYLNAKIAKTNNLINNMLRLLLPILFLSAFFGVTLANTYEVYRIEGNVVNLTANKPLRTHENVSLSTKLEIPKNGAVQIVDKTSNRVYKYNTPGITEVNAIIKTIKERSNSNIKSVNTQIASLAHEDKGHAKVGVRGGAVVRGEYDQQTADAYMTLSELIPVSYEECVESEALVLSALFVDADAFYFVATNLSDQPLYTNILSITDNGEASLCLDLSDESGEPYLLLNPGVCARLTDYVYIRGESPVRYMLFASAVPFDSAALSRMIESGACDTSTPNKAQLKTASMRF